MKDERSASRLGRRGFTLVELCVTGAAATALATAAVVGAQGLRGESHTAIDQMNLQTIGQAGAMYTQDNRGWLVGSPATSGRELLNAPLPEIYEPHADPPGDATQPFDWAGPLAWTYLAPETTRPDRRDERFALLNGTAIPDYMNPDFDPSNVDLTPAPGALGVFADPAQDRVSLPYDGVPQQNGLVETAFQPQLASSYIASLGFHWLPESSRPAWAGSDFWGGAGTVWQTGGLQNDFRLPGADGLQPQYRPRIDRVGDASKKIFLANGTRFQISNQSTITHDVLAQSAFGGAFADPGAWNVSFTRAWPMGKNFAGDDMTRISFRRGDGATPRGNVLYFDGSVELMSIDQARRPGLWSPRGSLVSRARIWSEIRDEYETDSSIGHPFEPFGLGLFSRMP